MKRFQEKVAVVTGGGGGIGSATCERLASEGALVIVVDLDEKTAHAVASKIVHMGGNAQAIAVDLSTSSACRELIAAVISAHGRIDLLVNNAGLMRRGDILSISEQDWSDCFKLNVDSMFHLCKAAIPHMIQAGGGSIVNTASQWGLYPAPNHIAYNVTKAAVASFTTNLARDCAPHNIRVNGVCPGEIHTPMLEAGIRRSGKTIDDLNKMVPFGRIGKPEEVAALIAFLASDEAPYICGSLVEITGAQAVA